jgi:enoyl-[acyl-carrier protein] reductase III
MRYLLIDRIVRLEFNQQMLAIKNVALSEDVYSEHFVGFPVMPGALLIEALAQAGTALLEVSANLKKKETLTALVTGGSRGIGRAIAVRLAATSAETVIVNYLRNQVEAEKTAKVIAEHGARCILARANLALPNAIDSLFETVRTATDHLDVFVHGAALAAFKPMMALKPNQWDLTMNINARAFLRCVQQAVSFMKSGKIIAVSSLGSQRVVPHYGVMGPAKAALEAIVRYLAAELAPAGILVNGVSGGFVQTDALKWFPENPIAEARRRTPAKRLGTPEDLAEVVAFLVSPAANWICGQTIVADGGLSLL